RNPGRQPLPFGLGYHPYFRVPFRDAPGADCWVEAPARSFWELRDNLPTGVRQPVDALRDLNQPRRFDALTLDDVLTDLAPHATAQGLLRLGQIGQAPDNLVVSLWASPAFRELVVFTPPHRQAICLEPYTCTTDAINLQARGIDAGLQRLEPGQRWSAVVELQVTSNSQATAGA
ncbi:MAG: hypothetical protein NZ700_03835, partial [Gemmataceae bacterium]|nr:hypothetical protein [Gemmataceae bacterium]